MERGFSFGHVLQCPGKRELAPVDLLHFQTRFLAPYKTRAGALEAGGPTLTALDIEPVNL